ncbi:MAG: hypothetical protein GTO14_15435 [Anaerolineales bacterium]|nr:hypothetical protein [Anaerolineales bacterium]
MTGLGVNLDVLRRFERELDPAHPERSLIPAKVLGYGEISTVFEIGEGEERRLAYKRLPMFKNLAEVEAYKELYSRYLDILQNRVGLRLVSSEILNFRDDHTGRNIVYIVQEKMNPEHICHKAMLQLDPESVGQLVLTVLGETRRVFDFNAANKGTLEVGFDGQISNWAILNFDPTQPLKDRIMLSYFDTSTPLVQENGLEQLNPELFLRSAPSFLVWIIRRLFLEDVMTRYYNFRKVVIDVIANFYKEQRPDLIPALVKIVNERFLERMGDGAIEPLTEKEIASYYREDALIWRFYLSARRIDRGLYRLLGRDYPYTLPGKIKR